MRLRQFAFFLQIFLNLVASYAFSKLLAFRFGMSAEKDGFDIAFSVPMIILTVGGFGYLSCAITTHVAKMLETAPEKIGPVFSTLLTYMVSVCVVSLVCCVLFTRQVTAVLAPGLPLEISTQIQGLLLYLLPLTITIGLSTFFAAVLTAYNVPVSTEFCLVLTRVGAIGYALWQGTQFTLDDVAIGLVVTSILATAIEWYLVCRVTGIRLRLRFYTREREFFFIVRQGASLLAATGLAQLSWAYTRRVATLDSVGMNATLTYVFSIVSAGSLLLSKPLALTQGPRITRLLARGDRESARAIVFRSVLLCTGLSFALAWLLTVVAAPVIRIVYGGGAFDDNAVNFTAEMFRYLVWGMPGSVVMYVIMMPMLSMKNEHAFSLIFASGHAAHLLLTIVMFPWWGRYGIALGYVVGATLPALVGGVAIYRDLRSTVGRQCHVSLAERRRAAA